MTKIQFLLALNEKLAGLPQGEVEQRLSFYTEMIEDRMEEGFSEEEAVAAAGNIDEIAAQIKEDIPFYKIAKEKMKPKRRLTTGEIILLIAGFPLWFPALMGLGSVVLSLYVAGWSIIVALWSVFAAAVGSALGFAVGGIVLICVGKGISGLALAGGAMVCAGVSIFLFFGCKAVTKGLSLLTGKTIAALKRAFAKKEVVQ